MPGIANGNVMKDGYQTQLFFLTLIPGVTFREVGITPLGLDGGQEIDTTSMSNKLVRTKWARSLIDCTPVTSRIQWNPADFAFGAISWLNMINKNGQIKIKFPLVPGAQNRLSVVFWGWLKSYKPGEHVEGQQPLATIEIVPSNEDSQGNEVLPIITAAP